MENVILNSLHFFGVVGWTWVIEALDLLGVDLRSTENEALLGPLALACHIAAAVSDVAQSAKVDWTWVIRGLKALGPRLPVFVEVGGEAVFVFGVGIEVIDLDEIFLGRFA